MGPARAVIVDFNGTLAEDDALLIGIYGELFREHGIAFEAGQYTRYAGVPDQAMFEELFAAHGRPLEAVTVDRSAARASRALSVGRQRRPPRGRRHRRVHAQAWPATSPSASPPGAFREEIEHVLEAAGLADLVSVIVAIDEVEAGKPHPESFTAALAHINRDRAEPIASHDTIVIEDTTDGARAARAAGMRCVALRGRPTTRTRGAAELVVERLTAELACRLLGSAR